MAIFHQLNPEDIRPVVAPPGDLDELIAIEVMGWKWMTFTGIPVKGTPGYPAECTVRQLLSKKQLDMPEWQAYVSGESNGTEPLAYTYCSSGFSAAIIPEYSKRNDALVTERIKELGLVSQFNDALKAVEKTAEELEFAGITTSRQICIAALEAVRGAKQHAANV